MATTEGAVSWHFFMVLAQRKVGQGLRESRSLKASSVVPLVT